MADHTTLTTGEAAKACGVSFQTVIRWIDSGRLPGHRFPGSGSHRRILRDDLLTFLAENGIPIPEEFLEQSVRVLIVEDEAAISLQMAEVLMSAGLEVAIAADGFTAGQKLATFDPDVMTLDLRMPGMPGIEVLKELRRNKQNKRVGILVVSGMPRNELEEALALGADEALAKPFRDSDLLEHVVRLADAAMPLAKRRRS